MTRLVVSAAHKSSGKTTFTVGLAAALTRLGRRVQCFKKGPDYIDPLWHGHAAGRPSYNLDFNTQTPEEIAALVAAREIGMDLALIEGNKGLHDGVDLEGTDSTAALAKLLDAPVILALDAAGVTRGIAPLLLGYRMFDPAVKIAGVVLNRVATARQEEKLVAAIERYTDVAVLGAIGRRTDLLVEERHLGLTTPQETANVERVVERLAETVAEGVDLARLETIVAAAQPTVRPRPIVLRGGRSETPADAPTIAVARDGAFCFYYQDDLEALERAGARLTFFSTLEAARLPDCDGLFIGGGFPESHVAGLEANASLRADIAEKGRAGLPIYAECGGLMYLSRKIVWGETAGDMVGLVPGDAVVHDRPQGRGLVLLEETAAMPWGPLGAIGEGGAPRRVRAHEFHYARLENLAPGLAFAWEVKRGDGITGRHDGVVVANTVASFAHLRDTSRFDWARRFVAFVTRTRERRRAGEAREIASLRRDPAVVGEAMALGGWA
ncbi:MAG: cobyrinate a,c-diamide synthase [Hyphomicrobiales bacterium]|nr:cobyrinate a,c-diamide synthase [Hyphomicrobiales bacterium]